LQSKSFPVEKLSAVAAGFLIGGESLAYRLDSTWKLISGGGSGVYRNHGSNGGRKESNLFAPAMICQVYQTVASQTSISVHSFYLFSILY